MTSTTPQNMQVHLRAIGRDLLRLADGVSSPSALQVDHLEPDLVRFARQLLRERRLREQFFEAKLFGEPVWDLLLDLFVASKEQRDISISSATIAASVPGTTALRYIAQLVQLGLLVRTPDGADNRRVLVALHPDAVSRVEVYLEAAWRSRAASLPTAS